MTKQMKSMSRKMRTPSQMAPTTTRLSPHMFLLLPASTSLSAMVVVSGEIQGGEIHKYGEGRYANTGLGRYANTGWGDTLLQGGVDTQIQGGEIQSGGRAASGEEQLFTGHLEDAGIRGAPATAPASAPAQTPFPGRII